MSKRNALVGVAVAAILVAPRALAQSSASFPPADDAPASSATAPAPSGSGAPSTAGTAAPPPPGAGYPAGSGTAGYPPPGGASGAGGSSSGYGGAPPPQPGPPARAPAAAPGQVLGPYRRSVDATMPGYGEADRPPPVMRVEHGDRRHDGLYARVSFGVGMASSSQATTTPIPSTNLPGGFRPIPYEGSLSGISPGTELAIGFTPIGGLVVGVGIDTATIVGGRASVNDPRTGDYVFRTSQLAIFSGLVDWYFDPELGFHAQAGVGLAAYVAGVGDATVVGPRAQAHTAIGFGFHLGAGYEFFVSREWSLGILGRLMYGNTSGSDSKSVDWTHSTLVPGAMLTGTYH